MTYYILVSLLPYLSKYIEAFDFAGHIKLPRGPQVGKPCPTWYKHILAEHMDIFIDIYTRCFLTGYKGLIEHCTAVAKSGGEPLIWYIHIHVPLDWLWRSHPGGGHSTFFQVGVCGLDFRSVGLANWHLPLKRGGGLVSWKFPNLGACELKISKFGGLWAKIWVKIEAVEAKISKFSQRGSCELTLLLEMGPLRAAGEAWKGDPQGRTSSYPLSRSVPPPPRVSYDTVPLWLSHLENLLRVLWLLLIREPSGTSTLYASVVYTVSALCEWVYYWHMQDSMVPGCYRMPNDEIRYQLAKNRLIWLCLP